MIKAINPALVIPALIIPALVTLVGPSERAFRPLNPQSG